MASYDQKIAGRIITLRINTHRDNVSVHIQHTENGKTKTDGYIMLPLAVLKEMVEAQ